MGFFQPPTADNNNVRIIKPVIAGAGGATWSWRDPFQIFTTLLLSLLLPFSFLLLARLSAAHYLSSVFANSHLHSTSTTSAQPQPSATIVSCLFFYSSNSTILYALVSLVSVAAFVHGLTAAPVTSVLSPTNQQRPSSLYFAWVLLCTFQVCVGLGIEGSISANIDGLGFGNESHFLIRALLLVGLHETMLFWSKSVVKPVVEDTVLKGSSSSPSFISTTSDSNNRNVREKIRWAVERAGMALSLGTLWWWRLREEVESLVVVPELMLAGGIQDVGAVAEFVGWCLYYLTVSTGTIRALKAVIWIGMRMVSVVCKNAEEDSKDSNSSPSGSVVSHHHHRHLPTITEDVL